MFIGRKNELAFLENLYNSNELHCVALEGVAGIGKTTLLQELGKRRGKAYFCVRSCTNNANKAAFLAELVVQGVADAKMCSSWQEALSAVMKKACGEKMLLLLDDVQELEAAFSELLPLLLEHLQKIAERLRLLVIFCGRETACVQGKLHKAGIYCESLQLQPLSYEESLCCLTPFSNDEKVLLYGVTGGLPAYLGYVDDSLSFRENLYNLFYAPAAYLLREGENILAREFRQPHIYHAVLCSVACGAVRMKEIAEAVGMSVNKVSKYVGVLLKAGLLEKVVPADEALQDKQHKNTFYMLPSAMLCFWYQFVYPYLGSIAMGAGKFLLRTRILAALEGYGRQVFLRICWQHCFTLRARHDFGFEFERLGLLWPKENCSLENLRMAAYGKNSVCYIQCLWSKAKVDVDVLRKLEGSYQAEGEQKCSYLLFSRKGFTDRALGYAARTQSLRLISLFYLK